MRGQATLLPPQNTHLNLAALRSRSGYNLQLNQVEGFPVTWETVHLSCFPYCGLDLAVCESVWQ